MRSITDETCSDSWYRQEIFSSPKYPDRLCGPPSLLCTGIEGLSERINRLGHEDNHSYFSSANVGNECSFSSISQYAFVSCRGKNLVPFTIVGNLKTLNFPQYKDINCFRQSALSFPVRRNNVSKVSLLAKCAGLKCLMDQSIRKGTFDAQ